MRVIVVGAGLSGLACAHRLRQAGVEVTVFERGDTPGGRAQTLRRDGYVIDLGPDAMTAGYTHYTALLDEFGLGDRVVACSPVIGLVRGGRIHDLALRRPFQLARSRSLSLRAKLALVRGYVSIRAMLDGVDPYELVKSARFDDPSTSAYDFGVERFGREIADYVIDPAMRLVTTANAREASVVNLLGAFSGWLSPLVNVVGGLDLLPHTLAAQTEIRYGAEVTAVEESSAGVTVSYRERGGPESTIDAEHCVITAMYDVASTIWPPLVQASPEFAHKVRNAQLIAVTLGYDTVTASQAYVVQVPTLESRDGLLILMQHNKAPDRAPAGHSLLTVYTDNAFTAEYLGKSDAELAQWGASLAETWCPELRGHRTFAHVGRWPKTAYLCDPGSWRRIEALMGALPREGRVLIAGDLFNASSMESAIRYGEYAARRIVG